MSLCDPSRSTLDGHQLEKETDLESVDRKYAQQCTPESSGNPQMGLYTTIHESHSGKERGDYHKSLRTTVSA